MSNLILNVTNDLLVSSKDGSLKVAFFDKPYKVNIKTDPKGKEISSEIENRLYIHIENMNDKFSVIKRRAGEVKVVINDEVLFKPEIELFSKSYEKYLEAKKKVTVNHESEKEILRKKIAELESKIESEKQSKIESEKEILRKREAEFKESQNNTKTKTK